MLVQGVDSNKWRRIIIDGWGRDKDRGCLDQMGKFMHLRKKNMLPKEKVGSSEMMSDRLGVGDVRISEEKQKCGLL